MQDVNGMRNVELAARGIEVRHPLPRQCHLKEGKAKEGWQYSTIGRKRKGIEAWKGTGKSKQFGVLVCSVFGGALWKEKKTYRKLNMGLTNNEFS